MAKIKKLSSQLSFLVNSIGKLAALLLILLLINVFYDVIMRYLFNDVSIGMQELEWHLFASVFLLGIAYTLEQNQHVRVDLIYNKLTVKQQAIVNISGAVILLLPFALLITYYGVDFSYQSFILGESSGDPGGLSYRFIIKAMISVSFLVLTISAVNFILKAVLVIVEPK